MQRSYMITITKRANTPNKQDANPAQYSHLRKVEQQLKFRREEIKRKYDNIIEPTNIVLELNQYIENMRQFYAVRIVPVLETDNTIKTNHHRAPEDEITTWLS